MVNTNIKVPTKCFGVTHRNIQPKFMESVAQNTTHQVSVLGEKNMVPWLPVPGRSPNTSTYCILVLASPRKTQELNTGGNNSLLMFSLLFSIEEVQLYQLQQCVSIFHGQLVPLPLPQHRAVDLKKNPSCAAAPLMKFKILEARNMSRGPCIHTQAEQSNTH